MGSSNSCHDVLPHPSWLDAHFKNFVQDCCISNPDVFDQVTTLECAFAMYIRDHVYKNQQYPKWIIQYTNSQLPLLLLKYGYIVSPGWTLHPGHHKIYINLVNGIKVARILPKYL